MSVRLSIVIPCYNCEKTLREAVVSCYEQGLGVATFEIVMVDDGSTDSTRALMESLASEYDNIRLFFHSVNKGGGAARNTGITEAKGDLMYCLDSDNLFAKNALPALIDYIEKNDLDGVAFHERRFFYGTDTKRYTVHRNTVINKDVELLDLFNTTGTLLDNFLYTKSSYLKTAGYPEHHGFDTQCFEMRYLAAGNRVRTCPNSIFYHRQAMQEKSYFERVHASGLFSVNFMLIFEDIFHLLTRDVQRTLLTFPIFKNNRSYGENILSVLKNEVESGTEIFQEDFKQYLHRDGRAAWLGDNSEAIPEYHIVKVFDLLQRNDYQAAHATLSTYIASTKLLTHYLEFLSLRILKGISGVTYADSVRSTLADTAHLTVTPLIPRNQTLASLTRKYQWLYQTLQYFKSLVK